MPRLHAIDDAGQDEAAHERRDSRGAHKKSRARRSQQRFGQGDVMGDEADLHGEPQREGRRGAR